MTTIGPEPPLHFVVRCPRCRQTLDVVDEDQTLMKTWDPDKVWNEMFAWAVIAQAKHRAECGKPRPFLEP